jgi:hypothetical protein
VAASTLLSVDFGIPNPPGFAIIGVVVYAMVANICYTGGWIAEIFIRKFWPREADRFATTSFFLGLLFSVFLTLIPGILVVTGGLFGLAHHLLRAAHAS